MDVIRVRAPSSAHAQGLVVLLGDGFALNLDGGSPATEVGLKLDADTAERLIDLFDSLGRWLRDSGLDAVQIGFGERTYTLLAPSDGLSSDPSAFLLERTIQLQTALDSRVVIEQAKGVLAERESISPDEAFDRMRREARSKQMKLRDLAAVIVATIPAARARSRDGH